jgi:hypothetical protein
MHVMKEISHIDKKWQSSVTACVEVTFNDGSHRYYLEGRYGGGSLTAQAYAVAKPYRPAAWKRYAYLPGRQGFEVTIMDLDDHLPVESSDKPAIKEELQ